MSTGKNIALGFWGLAALVFGMVVGGGVYNLPQNMAAGADVEAVIIAWGITALGMMLLVTTFRFLSIKCPEMTAGIYQFAQKGFGNYTGFNIAWGYWLCTCFANVAYAVMLNETLGAFFPGMLHEGSSLVISGSILIWMMYFLVSRGLRVANTVNKVFFVLKVLVVLTIIVLLVLNFQSPLFSVSFSAADLSMGSLSQQIKNTMLVTLWCFIGIEGAVMMSAKAKKPSDVGKAGIVGFLLAWLLYVLVSVLCYGVMTRADMAGLSNPSVAYVLKAACGEWAYWFVIVAVIVSVVGGWFAWTLICAEVPFEAAGVKIFPKRFMSLNKHGMPAYGLFISSLVMQVFLLMVVFANDVYMACLTITGMMILPAYLFCALYLLKISLLCKIDADGKRHIPRFQTVIALGCTLYCCWMLYAGGLGLLMSTAIFYLCGLPFFIKARKENRLPGANDPIFSKVGIFTLVLLSVCTILSAIFFSNGTLTL